MPPSGTCIADALGPGLLSFFQIDPPTVCRPQDESPFGEVSTSLELECIVHSHVELASDRSRNGSSKLPMPPESKVEDWAAWETLDLSRSF